MRSSLNKSLTVKEPPKDDVRIKRVLNVINKYGRRHDSLIEILHTVEEVYGYIPLDMMAFVAKELKMSPSKIYGVVTFYHFFSLKPRGEHTCVVCMGTACHVKGAKGVVDNIEEAFSIKSGETTPDGKFGLQTARCLGCCSLGPVVVLDNEIMAKVDKDKIVSTIKQKVG